MYKHALETLTKTILPYVIGVHGLDIPYPAELVRNGDAMSESGSVVFRINERGSLVAEYFSYKSRRGEAWDLLLNQSNGPSCVRLMETGAEIPVTTVRPSHKAGRMYNFVSLPPVVAYECGVHGWIGDPMGVMRWASATLDGCAILPLLQSGEKTIRGVGEGENRFPSTAYYDSRITEIIELTAGGWKASIHSFAEDKRVSLSDEPPYSISIRKCDDSTFELNEESEALQLMKLLRLLFSFSSERWVEYSTIYGGMPKAQPHVANRAFVGRFASRGWSQKREVDISELGEWAVLFQGLWDHKESPQMRSALTHLVSCGDRSRDGVFSYQDVVDAGGALEAAIRLWNDLPIKHRFFGGKKEDSLETQLVQVVSEFEMNDRKLDRDEVFRVVKHAFDYRHLLGHGSGGEIFRSGSDETGKVFVHQQYLYYLARLLVLAKLGGSTGHPGMRYYAPKLVPA